MKDALKKSVLAGLGAIDFSIEKAGEAVDKLVERGELSAEQGKKLLDELIERGRKDSSGLSRKIDEGLRKGLEKVTFVQKTAFQALETRVADLERRLAELESRAK
jgi:polyhydroxyalkanoate synthesis regulator phasin